MKKHNLILLMIGIFILGLLLGGVFLYGISSKGTPVGKILNKLDNFRMRSLFQRKTAEVIFDFEQSHELTVWKRTAAEISSSTIGATSGTKAVKIDFQPSKEASGIWVSRLFEKNRHLADWEGYESLNLDILNPEEKALKLIVRIKDRRGKKHKAEVRLASKQNNHVTITMAELAESLNLRQIRQMNIFFWESHEPHTLYLDNIHLRPFRSFQDNQIAIFNPAFLPQPGEQIYKKEGYFDFDEKRNRWLKDNVINVPLYVNNPTSAKLAGFPVSGGIPFPKRELKSLDGLRVLNHSQEMLAAQYRPLGYWSDGSIKWLQVDTMFDLDAYQKGTGYLQYGHAGTKKGEPSALAITEARHGITVNTGPLQFLVKKDGFHLLDEVWIDQNADQHFTGSERISSGSDLVLVHRGQEYRSSRDKDYTLTIEEKGPVKTTLKAEGWFVSAKRQKFCEFIVRMQAFAGEDFVRVFHTFIYTGYPANKQHYLYRGKRLPENETIEEIYIETPYRLNGNLVYSFGADNQSFKTALTDNVELDQDSSERFIVRSKGKQLAAGQRLEGWLDVSGSQSGVAVVVKNLWEQFPKNWTLSKDRGTIITYLWPKKAGTLDFQTTKLAKGHDSAARGSAFGLAKTHEMAFYFHNKAFDKQRGWNIVKLLGKSILASAEPQWIADTAAIGKVRAHEEERLLQPSESAIESMFDWAARQIEDNKWYGMIDFGDVLSEAHQENGQSVWVRDGRHGWMNNEAMGLHSGALVQYLRTRNYKYFEFGENAARHIMDVDTVHYNTVANDPRLRHVIPDDYSQVGSQHRHNVEHWGGRNEETSHTNLHGILLYYFMTGYERAFDVAKEIGDFFLKERVTYFQHPDKCPQRNIANLLWGTIEMYEATGDQRYKKVADKWADVLYKGQLSNGSWPENYNPAAQRWEKEPKVLFTAQYTLPAVVAYHQVTGNKAIAESIVKATKYFIKHKPYNPFFEGLLYSYYLTDDDTFLEAAHERLDYFMRHQRRDNNPITNGMFFQKASYLRPIEFLYQWPFVFEAVNEKMNVGKPIYAADVTKKKSEDNNGQIR